MSWFSKADAARVAPAGPRAAPAQRSLALRALLDGLHGDSRPVVLDLGPPLASNLRFLVSLGCRVRVADLFRSLYAEPVESRRTEALPSLFERLLPLAPDERFDAVLAWDVFDYMRKDQVTALMERLLPRLRRTAHLLLLVSMRSRIPASPAGYRIVDRETLDFDRASAEREADRSRPGPRYRQSDLAHMMPGLVVKRCYLLRSGIQEYLLAPGA